MRPPRSTIQREFAAALTVAGDVARVRSAFDRADVLLDHALDAARRVPAGPQRVGLEISALESLLSVSTQRSFMGVGLDEIAARIDEVAERNHSDHAWQLADFTRWSKINAVGPVATGQYASAALELAERSNEPYVVVIGQYVAGSQGWLSGRNDVGRDHFALALAMREQADRSDPPIRIPVISVYGMAAIAAQLAGADSEADALLRTQRRLLAPRPDSEVDMAFMKGIVLAVRGDAAGTLATTALTVEPSPPSWMPHFSAACRVLNTWAAVELGAAGADATAAIEVGAAALQELDAGPTSIGVPAFRTFFGAALLKLELPNTLAELRTRERQPCRAATAGGCPRHFACSPRPRWRSVTRTSRPRCSTRRSASPNSREHASSSAGSTRRAGSVGRHHAESDHEVSAP